jgi:hypothetical protein
MCHAQEIYYAVIPVYGVHGPTSCRRQLHRCCYVPHDRICPSLPIAIDGVSFAGVLAMRVVFWRVLCFNSHPGMVGLVGGSGRARAIMFLYRNVYVVNVKVHAGGSYSAVPIYRKP